MTFPKRFIHRRAQVASSINASVGDNDEVRLKLITQHNQMSGPAQFPPLLSVRSVDDIVQRLEWLSPGMLERACSPASAEAFFGVRK